MRILQYGGAGGHASSQQQAKYRSAAFRRNHAVGQKVKGRLLRWMQQDFAWVDVDGYELLAQLHTRPEPGDILFFQIVQLDPDIVLKQLHGDGSGYERPLTQQDILLAYWTARDKLDALLHAELWASSPSKQDDVPVSQYVATARNAFANFVAASEYALEVYVQVQHALAAVNMLLARANAGALLYQPWCLPKGKAVEYVVAAQSDQLTRLTLGAVLPEQGRTLVQALIREGTVSYRVFLDRVAHAPIIERFFPLLDGAGDAERFRYLGVSPLPAGVHDVLTSLLQPSQSPYGAGINTKT